MKAQTVKLGRTGPVVSRLIFGTEHIIDLTPEDGGAILAGAFRQYGVNHWDTAPAYRSHPQVASGLRQAGRQNIIVTSKTPAATRAEAELDLDLILDELDTSYLDICFLHNVRSGALPGLQGALDYLAEARDRRVIHHLGISSHVPAVLKEAAGIGELEIACGTLNRDGSRIDGGTLDDMLDALKACFDAGKGVYVIKILGAGDLVHDVEGALEFVFRHPFIHAYNIGMRNVGEVDENLRLIEGLAPEVASGESPAG